MPNVVGARLVPICASALLLACGGDDDPRLMTSTSVGITVVTTNDNGEANDQDGDSDSDGNNTNDDNDDDDDDTTTGTSDSNSGGLKLDPADVAFASLVNHNVGAAACSGSVRVVPGEPENSYVVAKLRNAPGICGLQMPRGRPPLPEEEIQTIEAWIAALPH